MRRRSGLLSAAAPGTTPEQIVSAFIEANARTFTLHPTDLKAPNALVRQDYETRHNGMRHIRWQQQKDGLDIYGATFALNLTKDNEIINVSSRALHLPEVRFHDVVTVTADDLKDVVMEELKRENASHQTSQIKDQTLLWYPLDMISVVTAWDLMVEMDDGRTHRLIVRADTGEVVEDIDLTWALEAATYNVYTDDSPEPMTPGPDTPTNVVPIEVPRELITLTVLDTNASPQGWIPVGENSLLGNNANVYADWDDNDSRDDPPVTGAVYRIFDLPLDLSLYPTSYVEAAQIQAFYWANLFHDRLHQLGFDEASGNFQSHNFGRGGVGGDPFVVEIQNGGLLGFPYANKAWYQGWGDGSPSKVVISIFGRSSPHRCGVLDGQLLYHEMTHGVSTRLIGNGFGLTTVPSRGLGEGWSDFFPLALLAKPGDDLDGCYAIATYSAIYQDDVGAHYFGIRRFPYSTDMTKAPQTLADIDPNQISFSPDIPRNPDFGSEDADQMHNIGEIWCLMLWECRANLIEQYGYAGNEMIMRLVVDGMKLTPVDPTFIQARDAILQGDLVSNNGTNQIALWKGFAKRGLGYSAWVPGSVSTVGIIEGYDLPFGVTCEVLEVAGDGDGYVEPGENATLTFTLTSHEMALTNVTAVLSVLSSNVMVSVSNAAVSAIGPGGSATSSPPFTFSVDGAFLGNTDAQFLLRIESEKGWFEQPLLARIGNPYDYPPEILNVAATNITETNAWIIWSTGIPADGLVEYGTTTNYDSSTPLDPVLRTDHLTELPQLAKGTVYYYRISSESTNGLVGVSEDFSFRTQSRIYVNVNSTATQELGTIDAPFKTIQAAAEQARTTDDDVLVACGTYTSTGSQAVLAMDGSDWNITVIGGYAGDFSTLDPQTHQTVIDGQGQRRGIFLDNGAGLEISGVVISNGTHAEYGGGIVVRKSELTATDCVIRNNVATNGTVNKNGGGVYATLGASVLLSDSVVAGNRSGFGGGIQSVSSDTEITVLQCTITDNHTRFAGGGVSLLLGAVGHMTQCLVTLNSSVEASGGGIEVAPFCEVTLNECTVAGNRITAPNQPEYDGGGGVRLAGSSFGSVAATIDNCVIHGNQSLYGNDLRVQGVVEVHVSYSDIGDIYGSLTTSNNLISVDPLFADPAAGDFHLKSQRGRWNPDLNLWTNDAVTSPCIDTGDPIDDFSLEPSPNGMRINMGAYANSVEASKSPLVQLMIEGEPSPYSTPMPNGYGIHTLPLGIVITNQVASSVFEGSGTRHGCTGWTGTGDVPSEGATTVVVFTAAIDSTLTWHWQTEHYLALSATNGSIGGAVEGWKYDGNIYDLLPSPASGYFLDHWETNGANAGSAVPLAVLMNEPKSVVASYAGNFIDVTSITDASFVSWYLSRQTGTYFGTLELTNQSGSGLKLSSPFWYAVQGTAELRLMYPDGTLPDGKDYIDISAKMLVALAGVGNGDNTLNPGESVLLDGIEFYSWDLSVPVGFEYAVWATVSRVIPDMTGADTDQDGMPNGWEQAGGLDENNPRDRIEDLDGDNVVNIDEYTADTDPGDSNSYLRISAFGFDGGKPRIEWIGGTSVVQHLDWTDSVTNSWTAIYTNTPPTQTTNVVDTLEDSGARGFYRIRATR